MPHLVSILIPTHNRAELLRQTLESIALVRIPQGVEVEVIVVANGCTDGTERVVAERVEATRIPVRCVIENELGLNVARNRAAREARGDILAFLDDDVLVDAGWVEGLMEVYEDKAVDMAGGRTTLWWKDVDRPDWAGREVESMLSRADHGGMVKGLDRPGQVVGANFSFRRRVWERIGGFKVGLDRTGGRLLAGGEHEFIQRALDAGMKMAYAPRAAVLHYVAPHRLSREYLDAVAHGRGLSRVLMLPHVSRWMVLRLSLSRGYQAAAHGVGEAAAKLIGSRKSGVRHRLMRKMAMGGLAGLWRIHDQ